MTDQLIAQDKIAEALHVARVLASAGVPVFVCQPDPGGGIRGTGYKLPTAWQNTPPDPAIVDNWQPGMALCMVTGCGLDLVDVDPRNGGDLDQLAERLGSPDQPRLPEWQGIAATPSGGAHAFVASLGVRSRDRILPGIDVKAGAADGQGRGFAFLPPTVKKSKVTGEPVAYRWVTPIERVPATIGQADPARRALAGLVDQVHTAGVHRPEGPDWWQAFLRNTEPQTPVAADRAITAKLAEVEDWQVEADDGFRRVLMRAALTLGGYVGGGYLDADEARQQLEAACSTVWGAPDDDDRRWIEQGLTDGALMPFYVADQHPDDGDRDNLLPTLVANPGRYLAGNTLQIDLLANDVIAAGPLAEGIDDRIWHYHGGVWRPGKNVVRDRVVTLMGSRYRSTHKAVTEDVVRSRLDPISCDPVPDVINFRNGLLNWRSKELAAHDPSVPTTVQLPGSWDSGADCPTFDRYLTEVLPADTVPVVWELIGYLLYSGNPLHKAVMLTGTGRNGKGTLLRTLTTLLGMRNITTVSLYDLAHTRFAPAALFGKLANIAGDIDGTYMENTAVFKAITGGDMINTEYKGRDRFDFRPWAVPVFSANKVPASADATAGYLSRWLVINFPHSFVGREDRWLDARLTTADELAGIARKGIEALPGLLQRGDFPETESTRQALAEFSRRVDQVRTWIDDCTVSDPEHWSYRTELYEAYKQWAARDGHRPVRATEFYDRLEALGLEPVTRRGQRGFKGLRVFDNGLAGGVWPAGFPSAEGPENQGAGAGAEFHPAPAPQSENTTSSRDRDTGASQEGHSLHPDETPDQTPFSDGGGAGGAATALNRVQTKKLNKIQRTRDRGGNRDFAAPPAPQAEAAQQPNPRPKRPQQTAEQRAQKAVRLRAERITEAGGKLHTLPAIVTADAIMPPPGQHLDLELLDQLLGTLTGPGGELTVDVETTGYPVGHRDYRLRTAQLGSPRFAVVLDPDDPAQAELIRKHLAAAPVLHAHSATADLVPLAEAGLVNRESAWARMHDTVIPAKLADPASTGANRDSDAGLKQLAAAMLGDQASSPAAEAARSALFKAGRWLTDITPTTLAKRSGWAQVDSRSATMIRYAAADVLDDAAIAARLAGTIPADVLERERTVQRMTARISHDGLQIDADRVRQLLGEHTAERDSYALSIRGAGVDNPGSGQQLAEALARLGARLPITGKGSPSVAKDVLTVLAQGTGPGADLARTVLDYRHHATLIGTFLEPYAQQVEHGDGRIRPTVYTLGTDTGRMSCARPNLQQVPRSGGIRACLTARPGHVLVSADFSGVEIRVAAALSGDQQLQQMIIDGQDLHALIAAQVWGTGPDGKPAKAHRYAAKRIVFGRLYGGGIGTLAKQAGVSEAIAGAAVDQLDRLTPGLAAWSEQVRQAVRTGSIRFPSYSGRIIHLQQDLPHKAPNFCIQGSARELLVDALLRWQQTPWGGSVLLPVHDELVIEVPEDQAEQASDALVDCMTTELFGVPIVAERGPIAKAWQDSV